MVSRREGRNGGGQLWGLAALWPQPSRGVGWGCRVISRDWTAVDGAGQDLVMNSHVWREESYGEGGGHTFVRLNIGGR